MKRMRLEGRTLFRFGLIEVDPKLRLIGAVVILLWVVFYLFGGEGIDSWILIAIGATGGVVFAHMFISTARWSWRGIGLLFVFLAICVLALPAGIVRLTGESQAPAVTRALWRASALVGCSIVVYWIIRYHQHEDHDEAIGRGGRPWDVERDGERRNTKIPGRRKTDRFSSESAQT